MMAHDLRRVARHRLYPGRYDNEPKWNFIVRPSLETTLSTIAGLLAKVEVEPTWIELDLETRAGHIACCGLSWSLSDAISIPFMCTESDDGYWNPQAADERPRILGQLQKQDYSAHAQRIAERQERTSYAAYRLRRADAGDRDRPAQPDRHPRKPFLVGLDRSAGLPQMAREPAVLTAGERKRKLFGRWGN